MCKYQHSAANIYLYSVMVVTTIQEMLLEVYPSSGHWRQEASSLGPGLLTDDPY